MDPVSSMLCVMALVQAFLGILLLGPKALALPVAQLLRPRPKAIAGQAVTHTVAVALFVTLVFSIYQLLQENEVDRVERRDTRGDVLATIDKLRAQLSCALSAGNLLLLYVLRALGEHLALYDWSTKNLDAMRRQVKGLQAEYERVTSCKGGDSVGSAAQEASQSLISQLRRQLDTSQQENSKLVAGARESEERLKGADINAKALKSQWEGVQREYDRVLAESHQLQQRLAVATNGGGGGTFSKKDA